MVTRVLIYLWLAGVCFACNVHESEEERLRQRINDIKLQLDNTQRNTEILLEVGKLMDSIDRNRFDVMVDWRKEKTPHNKYKYRLQAINNYVVETELKIQYLEKQIAKVVNASPDNTEVIEKLKDRIRLRNMELNRLKGQLARYAIENDQLFHKASLQDAEVDESSSRLKAKEEELEALRVRVAAAQEAYQSVQAEACYSQAVALEAVAERTRFAGAKKKDALGQALSLYRRAVLLGKEEAREKVQELEAQIQ